MVENEPVTGSLLAHSAPLARYSNPHRAPEIPPTPSAYEREPIMDSNSTNDERVRSPAPSWRGTNGTTPTTSGRNSGTNGAKRFHGSLNNRGDERPDPARMHADFLRYQRSNGKDGSNHVNGYGATPTPMTPPAGTGRVLGSEPDNEYQENGALDGLGDGGR